MDPFVTVLGIYASVAAYHQIQEYFRRRPRFRNATFGIGIATRSGTKSLFETILIEQLCKQGAKCVLAGRRQIAQEIAAADVMDSSGFANPERAIIGSIVHLVEPNSEFFNFTSDVDSAFHAWARHRFPDVYDSAGTFNEALLLERYQLTIYQAFGLFLEIHNQVPLLQHRYGLGLTPIHIQVAVNCHTADGFISASFAGERRTNYENLVEAYQHLVYDLIKALRIGQPVRHVGFFSEQRLNEVFDRVKAKLNERVYDDPNEITLSPAPYIDPARVAADRPDAPIESTQAKPQRGGI